MKVTKKTVSSFEVSFDESEINQLDDIEDIFDVTPEEMISRSINESLRLGIYGVRNLMRVVTKRKLNDHGNTGTDIQ